MEENATIRNDARLLFKEKPTVSRLPIILIAFFWVLVFLVCLFSGVHSLVLGVLLTGFALFSLIPYCRAQISTEVRADGIYVMSRKGNLLKYIPLTSVKTCAVMTRVSAFIEPSNALSGWVSSYAWGLRGKYYGFSGKGKFPSKLGKPLREKRCDRMLIPASSLNEKRADLVSVQSPEPDRSAPCLRLDALHDVRDSLTILQTWASPGDDDGRSMEIKQGRNSPHRGPARTVGRNAPVQQCSTLKNGEARFPWTDFERQQPQLVGFASR